MLDPEHIYDQIRSEGVDLFTGVPDSLLKEFSYFISTKNSECDHVITANEGNAIALATGHFLGSGKPALVYMQNSGIGNAINPLISLADREVYSIPMLLMVGWRGEPGTRDEPQHIKQGRILPDLLNVMEIPWFLLEPSTPTPATPLTQAMELMRELKSPVAVLVRKGTFKSFSLSGQIKEDFPMTREESIQTLVECAGSHTYFFSTTGMASRELYEIREISGHGHANDFLTVGSMGHSASIAMGFAMSQSSRQIICIDGDGSILMHMGSLAIIGQSRLQNLLHVVINNGAHDSVGGQPTVGLDVDIGRIALSCGYRQVLSATTPQHIREAIKSLHNQPGPKMLEIKVRKGARRNLGRPKNTPVENLNLLMNNIQKG